MGDVGVPLAPVERRYTVAEVAEAARVSADTVLRDIHAGVLKARRKRHASRGYVVLEGELRRWLEDEFEEVGGGRAAPLGG